jgi:hypothetical protein
MLFLLRSRKWESNELGSSCACSNASQIPDIAMIDYRALAALTIKHYLTGNSVGSDRCA